MKTSSAKQKGRRCALEAIEKFMLYAQDDLRPGDLVATSSGVTGPDIVMSPKAKEIYPIVCECKNQEKLNIWDAIKQSEGHTKEVPPYPVVIFKRNNTDIYICLKLEHYLKQVR